MESMKINTIKLIWNEKQEFKLIIGFYDGKEEQEDISPETYNCLLSFFNDLFSKENCYRYYESNIICENKIIPLAIQAGNTMFYSFPGIICFPYIGISSCYTFTV